MGLLLLGIGIGFGCHVVLSLLGFGIWQCVKLLFHDT